MRFGGKRIGYIADLAPYGAEGQAGRLAVGWLEDSQRFERGTVGSPIMDNRFVEVLRWAAVHRSVDRVRGIRHCELGNCDRPVSITFRDRQTTLGSAQIETDIGGIRYVAPDLIAHYVDTHGYRPPAEFVRSALVGSWKAPENYRGTHKNIGPGLPIQKWSKELALVFWEALATRIQTDVSEVKAIAHVEVHTSEVSCLYTPKGIPSILVTMKKDGSEVVNTSDWIPTVSGTCDLAEWMAELLEKDPT